MKTHRTFQKGDCVKHFKRDLTDNPHPLFGVYEILGKAKHTETGEMLIIYKACYVHQEGYVDTNDEIIPCLTYACPEKVFMSEVDKGKYPDAKQRYCFELVEFERG